MMTFKRMYGVTVAGLLLVAPVDALACIPSSMTTEQRLADVRHQHAKYWNSADSVVLARVTGLDTRLLSNDYPSSASRDPLPIASISQATIYLTLTPILVLKGQGEGRVVQLAVSGSELMDRRFASCDVRWRDHKDDPHLGDRYIIYSGPFWRSDYGGVATILASDVQDPSTLAAWESARAAALP